MKLFKRIVAGLLACAMALSMAACGGGGGGAGASTAKTKLANTPLATGGNVTLESVSSDDPTIKIKIGSNGTSLYARDTESGVDIVYLKNSSGIYAIDMTKTNKTAQNVSSNTNAKVLMGLFEAMLDAKDNLASAQNGQIEISGKTYDSAIITTKVEGGSYDIAYCFDGDTLKYVSFFSGTSTNAFLTLAVNSVNGSVDSSLLTTNGWTSGGGTTTQTVTVSVTASGSGSVSGGGTYTKGKSVTVVASPSSGYTFAGWQKNGTTVSTSTSYTFTASESVALTAVFKQTATTNEEVPIDAAHFPDSTFRSYVSTNFDKDSSGGLSKSEIAAATEIYVSTMSISSLKGIEYFTALERLALSGCKVTSLDISKNTALVSLVCWQNKLTSLDVSKNSALEYLDCNGNYLTSLNVSKNLKLKYLNCAYNKLTSLSVSNNTVLETLSCAGNSLSNLDVSKNPALKVLDCTDCNLTSLDVSKNPLLEELTCVDNKLTSINVSKNPALTDLACSSNSLTSLDVSKNSALKGLSCHYNKLSGIDVSSNSALEWVTCDKGVNVIKGASSSVYISYTE